MSWLQTEASNVQKNQLNNISSDLNERLAALLSDHVVNVDGVDRVGIVDAGRDDVVVEHVEHDAAKAAVPNHHLVKSLVQRQFDTWVVKTEKKYKSSFVI